jgi:hypothetical protein
LELRPSGYTWTSDFIASERIYSCLGFKNICDYSSMS